MHPYLLIGKLLRTLLHTKGPTRRSGLDLLRARSTALCYIQYGATL